MAIISLQSVILGFGGPKLLDGVNLQIEKGERIGLLGRNGMGKSTLLKLIYGDQWADRGEITRQQGLRLAYLPQEVPEDLAGSIGEVAAGGLEELAGAGALAATDLETPWQRQLQVEQVLSRMGLDGSAPYGALSAGMKRRVMLARGLARRPDVMLLDEPTNHLDIATIDWMEDFLLRWGGTLLFVTHDRVFLQRMATRIIELDRGALFNWNCDYLTYLRRKEGMLAAEQAQNAIFDQRLAQEEAWIRRGVEARRTRNEGRVRALLRLRELRRERRDPGRLAMQIQEARRTGRLVLEVKKVSYAYGERPILKDFSTTLQRGDRVGIIGPNGSGKTTLLRVLLGELAPQHGSIKTGSNLEPAYFDQLRATLDEDKSAYDNVGQGRDVITVNGKNRNLISYLEDFLFERERIKAPIRILSGGERNRLLLARLFSLPANLLVLDEPTNDLDLETLELLEDLLLAYHGTLLLVSHDRAFLNNLVTSTLALDGSGTVKEYVGGYDDWVRQSQAEAPPGAEEKPRRVAAEQAREEPARLAPRKPSYNEQRAIEARRQELAALPGRIEALEAEQARLTEAMGDPAFYQQESATIAGAAGRLKELEAELAQAFARWEELEE